MAPEDDGGDLAPSSPRKANQVDEFVGLRLKQRRQNLGLSQESLGRSLGLTFQQIQKYEHGVNRIGAGRLFELAQLLGVPISYFYDGLQTSAAGEAPHGFSEEQEALEMQVLMQNRDVQDLVRAFLAISDPKVRRNLLEIARNLSRSANSEE